MENLASETEAYAKHWGLWEDGSYILTACSGGADSMALLSVLLELSMRANIRVAAAHFHHGIRGREADEDAEYVRNFCAQRNVPCLIGAGDVPAYATQHKLSMETAARKLRYDFLYESMRKLGASVLAVAHHADDQAETVMMRILRGTGIDGLAAMRPKSGMLIRPLLFAERELIEAYCCSHDIEPRHDTTNDVPDILRNRLRHFLFPLLRREYNPSIREALCRLASIASDNTDFLEEMGQKTWNDVVLEESVSRIAFSKCAFQKLPRMLGMEILRTAVQRLGGEMTFSFVQYEAAEALFRKSSTGKRLDFPGGIRGSASSDAVMFIKGLEKPILWEARKLNLFGETRIEELALTVISRPALPGECVQGRMEVLVDAKHLRNVEVRRRKRGDRFAMGTGTQSVKKLLMDRKIPREKRDEIPLIVSAEQIVWVAGIRQADIGRAEKGKKAVYLRIQYDKMPEWLK